MFKLTIAVLISVAACSITPIHRYRDCGSHGGRINALDAEGCHESTCFYVHPGSTYTIRVNFTATTTIHETSNKLHGVFGPTVEAFGVTPQNICGHGGVRCPVHAGDIVVYEVTLQCPADTQPVKLASKWELQLKNGTNILCFVVGLEITP